MGVEIWHLIIAVVTVILAVFGGVARAENRISKIENMANNNKRDIAVNKADIKEAEAQHRQLTDVMNANFRELLANIGELGAYMRENIGKISVTLDLLKEEKSKSK